MEKETIVLCFPVEEDQVAELRQVCPNDELVVSTQERIGEDIFRATVFCGHAKTMLRWGEVVSQGRLKWIQSTAAGLDHCLAPSVVQSDILVSGASGLFARQVAEQTTALLFGLLRRLPDFFRAAARRVYERLPTDELQGKVVGILGFGGNGQQIAECLRPFQCTLLATDHFPEHCQRPGVEVLHSSEMEQVLKRADIVIVTLPLLPTTKECLGERQFALMRPGSYLINVGRGQLLDERALVASLQSGHLAGAGLDVAYTEPLPADSPLWDQPQILITPHVGAQSRFRVPDTVQLFKANLQRWRRGERLWNQVDKDWGVPLPEDRLPLDWRRH